METLKYLRKEKMYTSTLFAEKIGVTRQYLWMLEKGKYKPSVEIIMAIADTLKISVPRAIKLFKKN